MKIALFIMWLAWGLVVLIQKLRGKSWTDLLVVVGVFSVLLLTLMGFSAPAWFVIGLIIAVHAVWVGVAIYANRRCKKPRPRASVATSGIADSSMRPTERCWGLLFKHCELTVSVGVRDAEGLKASFSAYKEHCGLWVQRRGHAARKLLFVTTASFDLHPQIVTVLQGICNGDDEYRRAFSEVITEFALLDEHGFLREKYKFVSSGEALKLLHSYGPKQVYGPFTPNEQTA